MAETEDKKPTFGNKVLEILVRNGSAQEAVLRQAEEEAKASGVRFEKYVVDKSIVQGAEMTLALSEYLQMSPMSLLRFTPNPTLLESLPSEVMRKHMLIPIVRTGKSMTVALADPFDFFALDELHILTGLDIMPVVAAEKEVKDLLDKLVAATAGSIDMEDIMKGGDSDVAVGAQPQEEGEKQSIEEMMASAEDTPVIKTVNMILIESLRLRANDIHIEPQEDYIRLRYRVDGVLIERPHLPKTMQSAITSRVKIMADIDIGEQRLPQDGGFRINALGKKIDVRVSVLPTIFGGKVVMRTLDKTALFPDLGALNLEEHAHAAMSYAIAQPHGIILVTGPTGSGKTTTLYSCLSELNKPDVNIVTCENPVEYKVPGLNQVQIQESVGMTFASALRAILRQDPDIVLIGEIRDTETCEIAIKAALTGHLVLSTLHSNEAAGAITRLLDMGIEPFLVASSVILTQGQRLVRKLCGNCKRPLPPNKEMMEDYRIKADYFEGVTTYGPQGCPKCNGTGFLGRVAIMEVLPVGDAVRAAILQQKITAEIRDVAVENGMLTMLQSALLKVKDGTTSLEAALRVTGSGE